MLVACFTNTPTARLGWVHRWRKMGELESSAWGEEELETLTRHGDELEK